MKAGDTTAATMTLENIDSPFEAFVGTIVWNYLALEAHSKNLPASDKAFIAIIMGAVFSVCFVAAGMADEIKKGKLRLIILNLVLNILAIRIYAHFGENLVPLVVLPPLGLFIWSQVTAR